MIDLTPREPRRPLIWTDAILDLRDLVHDDDQPIYIVGGAVRDALLHRPIKDIDLATAANATQLARRIANHFNGDVYVMDAERDVARALFETYEGLVIVDVAGFRGDDLLADLTDRDFTLNAIAVELTGDITKVVDPLNGEQDTHDRLLRRCSDHAIADDPIRSLRAVRQSTQLSARIEHQTLADIREQATRLADVSAERVRDEFFKLLALPNAPTALRVAQHLGLLSVIVSETSQLPEFGLWESTLLTIDRLRTLIVAISPYRTDNTASAFSIATATIQFDRYRPQLQTHIAETYPNERSYAALMSLGALLLPLGRAVQPEAYEGVSARIAASHAEALRLSNPEKSLLVTMIDGQAHPTLMIEVLTAVDIHRFWHRFGEIGIDVILLWLAHFLGVSAQNLHQDAWVARVARAISLIEAYYDHHDTLVAPPVLVNGKALQKELGLKPGPIIGELLDALREAQVSGQINTPDDALAFARDLLASN